MFSKHYIYNDVDKKQGKATSYSKIPYITKFPTDYFKVKNYHQTKFSRVEKIMKYKELTCTLHPFFARINFREWVNISDLKECLRNCPLP